jgi:hypothetical protein
MNPLGIFELVFVALEGVAHAFNPKLKRKTKKDTVGFALLYIAILVGGIAITVIVIRDLYFK